MKTSSSRTVTFAAIGLLVATVLSGCAWSVGGSKRDSAVNAPQPTKGQELLDLQKAKDQGAITEEEYQAQRQRILDK